MLQQIAYMHTGDLYPVKVIFNFNNAHECQAVGKYYLSPQSFRVNLYGSLELDRFNLKFVPV
jgi:hypothetical protein